MRGKIVSEIKEDKSLTVVSEIDTLQLVKNKELQGEKFNIDYFLSLGFTHHMIIIRKAKTLPERIFYIRQAVENKWNKEVLAAQIDAGLFSKRSNLPNNFTKTIPSAKQALMAIQMFKDEYLLDFINVEQLGIRDKEDIDENVLENAIVQNVKNFILSFGKDFAFIRNQYYLDAFGEDQYIDLLFRPVFVRRTFSHKQ